MDNTKFVLVSSFITLITFACRILFVFGDSKPLPKFPAIFVFGDSTVDSGNNNYINTFFKSNFLPYGQDLPGHLPTGRFCNGKLVTDHVASFLGIKDLVPPFLDPMLSDDDIRTGVSFASAGSGYDDLTVLVSNVIPVSAEIGMFERYVERLNGVVGEEEAKKIVEGALVLISAGTNDFVFNFYDLDIRTPEFNITGYQSFLLDKLQNFTKNLYGLGSRTMVIAGVPPIGCLPIQMTANFQTSNSRECLENQNSDAEAYNAKLRNLLPQLQASLPGSKLFYADIYGPLFDMMTNPQKYGFVETKKGCCGTGLVEASFLCNPMTPVCGDADHFLFWDSIHPSQATYSTIAKNLIQNFLTQYN